MSKNKVYRRKATKELCTKVNVSFLISVADLVNHLKRYDITSYSWDYNDSMTDHGLLPIHKISKTKILEIAKDNLKTYGFDFEIDYPAFTGDNHERWFKARYKDAELRILQVFPELSESSYE